MAMFEEVAGLLNSGDSLSGLAQSIGGDEAGTRTAVSAAVPVLLGGLSRRASTAGGATSLIETLNDTDGSLVDNVGQLFGAKDKGEVGSTLSNAILGGRAETVESTIASSSGLSGSAVSRLLAIAAPTVMSLLARRTTEQNLDRQGMSSLLDAERTEMDSQGFGPWLALLDSDTVVDDDTGFQAGLAKVAGLGGLGALGVGAAATAFGKTQKAPSISMPPTASPSTTAATRSAASIDVRLPETETATFTSTSTPGTPAVPTASAPAKSAPLPTTNRSFESPTRNPVEPTRTPEPEKRARLRWLKWLLPLLLIGLLAFILWGCLNEGGSTDTDTEGQAAATAVATAVPTEAPTEVPTEVPVEEEEVVAEPVDDIPVDGGYTPGRIPAIAQEQGIFNTLLDSLDATGLTETLGTTNEFTIFAPSDAAFSALDPELIGALSDNPNILREVLSYHVVPGYVTADQLETGAIASALGTELAINVESFNPRVNGAFILTPDITADNGVIHGIDRVLIPQSVLSFAGLSVNDALALDPINFEVGSADLTAQSEEVLNSAADYLRSSRTSIEIGGHTDDGGEEESNQTLSEARAQAVLDYLVANGVPADQLTSVGFGESQPLQDNGTAEGRAANRRIELNAVDR